MKLICWILCLFFLFNFATGLVAQAQMPDQTVFNLSDYKSSVSHYFELEKRFKKLKSQTNAFTNISFEISRDVYLLLVDLHDFRLDLKEHQTLIELDCTGLSVDTCRQTDIDLEVNNKVKDINQIVEQLIDEIIIGWREHAATIDISDDELVTLDLLTYLMVSEFYNMQFKGQLDDVYNRLIEAFPITAENVWARVAILKRKTKKPYYDFSELKQQVNVIQQILPHLRSPKVEAREIAKLFAVLANIIYYEQAIDQRCDKYLTYKLLSNIALELLEISKDRKTTLEEDLFTLTFYRALLVNYLDATDLLRNSLIKTLIYNIEKNHCTINQDQSVTDLHQQEIVSSFSKRMFEMAQTLNNIDNLLEQAISTNKLDSDWQSQLTENLFSVDKIQTNLDKGELIYFRVADKDDGGKSHYWAIKHDELLWDVTSLPNQGYTRTITQYINQLDLSQANLSIDTELKVDLAAGFSIYENLFGYIDRNSFLQDIEILHIIPDRFSRNIPFAALPKRKVKYSGWIKTNDSRGKIKKLIWQEEDHKLLSNLSAVDWLGTRFALEIHLNLDSFIDSKSIHEQDRVTKKMSFVGFGDPIFESSPGCLNRGDISLKTRVAGQGQLCRLPETAIELEKLKGVYSAENSRVFTQNKATEDNLINELNKNYDVIALSTHVITSGDARLNREHQLILTRIDAENDGIIEDEIISNLNVQGSLVMLNGCSTAASIGVSSRPYSGLVSSFLRSGARQVFASMWAVPSKTTSNLIGNYLVAELKKRKSFSLSRALKTSLSRFIKTEHDVYKHPYFWGGFVLVSG